ncbi:MAG TPA: sigma-54 dependent transcriptional regulator [Verrucomicrobiae bacterium]|nr:sigma-54 dependent transcriptional regulator [Verrucomicrobiae bacterium]
MSFPDKFTCLIVDDDAGFVSMLARAVRLEGGETATCSDLKSARAMVEQRDFQLVVLDNRLPDGTGYEFFPQLMRQSPESLVVMVTGVPELSQAVELTRNGLFDYLTKPLNLPDFVACLGRARQRWTHPDNTADAVELVGNSPQIREVLASLRQIARHPETTVLLTGETGTGKDLAARRVHELSHPGSVATAPYIPLNCSAVPPDMFESELFGVEKGAFTGAERRREGLVEAAMQGTLLLDEITEMPLAQQSKLLRFLESHEYRSLGSNVLRKFSGRIIAATNRSLLEEVKRGRFREDLMYRLAVVTVHLPALRDRMSDLQAIIEFLLARLCEKYSRKKPALKDSDLEALRKYRFPGNVRELRNLLERALLHTAEYANSLAFDLAWLPLSSEVSTGPAAFAPVSEPAIVRQLNAIDMQEYRLIQQALIAESGGIRRAAARLGINHQSLLRRLEKWPELRIVAPQPK